MFEPLEAAERLAGDRAGIWFGKSGKNWSNLKWWHLSTVLLVIWSGMIYSIWYEKHSSRQYHQQTESYPANSTAKFYRGGTTTQSTYICRVQSCVWRLPKYWPPTPLSTQRVCPPPKPRARVYCTHSPGGGGGDGGVIILKDARHWIGLVVYSIISLRGMTWTGDLKCREVKNWILSKDKCKPVLLWLSLAGNLVRPLLPLYETEWKERGYGLWAQHGSPIYWVQDR